MDRRLLCVEAMSFAAVANRVCAEFLEMPGLELTMPQAVRLWNLGPDDCRSIVDSLVDAGFLRWTSKRTIIWAGRDSGPARPVASAYVSVGASRSGVNCVAPFTTAIEQQHQRQQ